MGFISKSVLIISCLVTVFNPSFLSARAQAPVNLDSIKIVTILAESFVYYQSGLNLKAYNKSMEAYQKIDSWTPQELKGKVYNHVGNFALESELFDEAIENYNKALTIYKEIESQKNMAATYGNLAVVFEYLDKPDLSLEYSFKALDILSKSKDTLGISNGYTNIGNTYADLGEYNLCRNYFIKALYLDSISMDTGRISTDYNNLGYLHSVLKDHTLALKYYQASLSIDKQLGDAMGECITRFNIGNVNYELGEISKALSYALSSYRLAQELHSVNYLMKNSNLLSKIYTKKNNDKEAYRYFEAYKTWSDSNELRQEKALLYARQLESQGQKGKPLVDTLVQEKNASIDARLTKLLRVLIYLGTIFCVVFLVYKLYLLFTKR